MFENGKIAQTKTAHKNFDALCVMKIWSRKAETPKNEKICQNYKYAAVRLIGIIGII